MGDCFGVILAGGLARRMGGVDKGLLEIGGRPILAHVVERLRPQCAGLVLNANLDPGRFDKFGLPVVADDIEGFAGPLAGVLAGLDYIAAHHPDIPFAVSAPSDTPFIPRDLVSRLCWASAETGADVAVASSGGQRHYAVALWKVALRGALREALVKDDMRSVGRFIEGRRNAVVEWPIEPYDPFFNVNQPEDLATAAAISAKAESLL